MDSRDDKVFSEDSVFHALRVENNELVLTRLQLQAACRRLHDANGHGDSVRQKIYRTLLRMTGEKNGAGQ